MTSQIYLLEGFKYVRHRTYIEHTRKMPARQLGGLKLSI